MTLLPFFVFFGCLVIEAMLLALWVPSYYRVGVRICRARIPTSGAPVTTDQLEGVCRGNLVVPPLVFRYISESEIGFQEKGWPMRWWNPYLPVMRGLIIQGRDQAQVVGILLWYPVVGFMAVLLTGLRDESWEGLSGAGAVALGIGVMAALQWARFRQVRVAVREASAQGAQ